MVANLTEVTIKSTGSTATRTLGARFADIKNVKDFGATGDGSTDDTTAIQAAVDYATAPFSATSRGTIYFPPGTYKVTSAITFSANSELSIHFMGSGRASKLVGNFSGFILDRFPGVNNQTSGNRTVEKLWIVNSHASGGAIRICASVGAAVRDCTISANQGISFTDGDGNGVIGVEVTNNYLDNGGNYAGSNGIIAHASGVYFANDITGFEKGLRAFGGGVSLIGNRFEVCGTGIALGDDPASLVNTLTNFHIMGGNIESCGTGIDFVGGCGHFLISGVHIIGFENAAPSGGDPQYGIRVRNSANHGLISGCTVGSQQEIACISIESASDRSGLLFQGVECTNSSTLGGTTWVLPTTAHTADFSGCDVNPTFLFAGLPTGGNVRMGDTYYITDGNQATIGGNVTAGSSSNKSWVTYDGTNWKRGV